MNKLINKILKEAKEINDDQFFKPKDIEKRKERREKEFISKIKLGLKNIKVSYKNKNWESKEEKLFLQRFCTLHLNKEYSEEYDGYFLLNENDTPVCVFSFRYGNFSCEYIWSILRKEFNWNYHEIELFIKKMLHKYFKLDEWMVDSMPLYY